MEVQTSRVNKQQANLQRTCMQSDKECLGPDLVTAQQTMSQDEYICKNIKVDLAGWPDPAALVLHSISLKQDLR